MDELDKYRFNCVNVSAGDDQYVKEWSHNETEDLIQIALTQMYPHSIYSLINSTYYQWCGPFVLIAQKFAQLSKLRYNFKFMTRDNHKP